MPRINPATLPQKLKDTHAMTFKIKDPRRREPYGLDGVTCTKLRATSQGLPNGKDIHKSVLKLRRREDEEAEEEEELQKENPEDPDEQKLCERLQQKLAAFPNFDLAGVSRTAPARDENSANVAASKAAERQRVRRGAKALAKKEALGPPEAEP